MKLDPDSNNNLVKSSAVDTLQLRGLDTKRLTVKIGETPQSIMDLIVIAITTVIDFKYNS